MRWKFNVPGIVIALLTSALLIGCGDDTPGKEHALADVNLVIRVAVNNPGSSGSTRTPGEEPAGYPYEFEAPATKYESINSLRIIIVRPDNTVEHNRVEYFTSHAPVAGEEYGDFTFKVKLGEDDNADSEKKRIYLIANEKSITPAVDFTNGKFVVGATLTPGDIADLLTYSEWHPGNTGGNGETDYASPYINNEVENEEEKRYIPMTEFFDITVKRDKTAPNAVTEQKETLFVTRNLVKFAFLIKVEDNSNNEFTNLGSFKVRAITFHNLMQKEYLFPSETYYIPAKYSDDSQIMVGSQRVITSFKTPGLEGNLVRPYRFDPVDFGYSGKGGNSQQYSSVFFPELYFCETENNNSSNKFYLSLEVEFEDGEILTYSNPELELPNLPSFPRNTIVKVVLQFSPVETDGQVDLVPYIGIVLTPGFGFDDVHLPGDHEKPEDW